MATLRVPSMLLLRIEKEKGMAFLVSITAHMVGEMSRPSSILVDGDKLPAESRQLLTEYGCKEVKD